MNHFSQVMQSTDVINFNSKNIFVEISVTSSKRVTDDGNQIVKVDCSSRLFRIINGQRIFGIEEQRSSKIYFIKTGNLWEFTMTTVTQSSFSNNNFRI